MSSARTLKRRGRPARRRPEGETACRHPVSRGALALLVSLVVLVAASAVGCGKKGPPRPPPQLIPAQTTDLVARQTGTVLTLELTYPAVTTSGLPLAGIDALEISTLRPPASVAAVAAVAATSMDPRTFAATAAVLRRLEGPELIAATRGSRLLVELDAASGSRLGPVPQDAPSGSAAPAPAVVAPEDAAPASPVDPAAPEDPEATSAPTPTPAPLGRPPVWIAIRTFGPRGNESPLSNLVAIVPRLPPPPPETLTATATADGVRLEWTASPGDAPVPGAPAVGFDVLRRREGETSFETRIAAVGVEVLEHVDASAAYGERYEYTVRTVAARDPLAESADGPVRRIEYGDLFAPPTPGGLVALAEEGSVRLLWNRVEAADLAGYRLYRQEAGGDEIELPRDPGIGTDHIDGSVRAGVAYTYQVTAVDGEGNESERSEPARATPR